MYVEVSVFGTDDPNETTCDRHTYTADGMPLAFRSYSSGKSFLSTVAYFRRRGYTITPGTFVVAGRSFTGRPYVQLRKEGFTSSRSH